jgi:uncharacterized membrane protein YuzA (DUF378 family)
MNGIGTTLIAIFYLNIGLPGVVGLVSGSMHFGVDPDGRDKVLAIQVFSVVVGIIALVSVLRTVTVLRESTKKHK